MEQSSLLLCVLGVVCGHNQDRFNTRFTFVYHRHPVKPKARMQNNLQIPAHFRDEIYPKCAGRGKVGCVKCAIIEWCVSRTLRTGRPEFYRCTLVVYRL